MPCYWIQDVVFPAAPGRTLIERCLSKRRRAPAWRLARSGARLGVLLGLLSLSTGCLNPALLNQQLGGYYPTAPGDQRFVLVRVINDTPAVLDVPIVYDNGIETSIYLIDGLTPEGRETGVLLDWPVLRVGIGDLDNPLLPSIIASFPDGGTSFVPFGQQSLQTGVDYNNGDAILFYINEDNRSPLYITVSVGLIDGDTQLADFSRGDPFAMVTGLLAVNGF